VLFNLDFIVDPAFVDYNLVIQTQNELPNFGLPVAPNSEEGSEGVIEEATEEEINPNIIRPTPESKPLEEVIEPIQN